MNVIQVYSETNNVISGTTSLLISAFAKDSTPTQALLPSPHLMEAETITAYHVSNVEGLTLIKPNICDSEKRDDRLFGASVACFTTTTWRGNLPTVSPYPRSAQPNTFGYRYTMKFAPSDYFKFQMADTPEDDVSQVHFLLLKQDNNKEAALAEHIRQKFQGIEDREWSNYFKNGRPNDYERDEGRLDRKVFVNVMFWHVVPVSFRDEVEKRGKVFSLQEVDRPPAWLAEFHENEAKKTEYNKQKQDAASKMLPRLEIGTPQVRLETEMHFEEEEVNEGEALLEVNEEKPANETLTKLKEVLAKGEEILAKEKEKEILVKEKEIPLKEEEVLAKEKELLMMEEVAKADNLSPEFSSLSISK